MSARNYTSQQFTLARDVVTLYGRFTGAGDATPTALKGLGITSVAYASSAGLFTLTLTDKYNGLLDFSASVIDVTTPDDWSVVLTSDLTSSKVLGLSFFKGGTLTSPTTDEKVIFRVVLSNSAQLPAGY